ncbi:hypothetical protein SmJEL517_g05797 [Synchytrium microbalum]|uniref:ABC transporter domain-containing protein n=1 Tax=Synchytrium microbalum TaxID=1806994 RepID=A0A507BM08_9FUNG|nr:uncharacterized protein SmJEL517_g05797 [Synchytrium microbalum]TPX30707.1 hypothetical protein SmJEL517_g05797 [Synchytrium microbalum]
MIRAASPSLLKRRIQTDGPRRHRSVSYSPSAGVVDIKLDGIDVFRFNSKNPVLKDIRWTISAGQTWAVIGPVGSGRSTLGETLAGRHRIEPFENGSWEFIKRLQSQQTLPVDSFGRPLSLWTGDLIKCVSFKEESAWDYSRGYYQQRYNWIDYWEDTSLEGYLKSGLEDLASLADEASLNSKERRAATIDKSVKEVARQFDLEKLLTQSFSILSNGQTRRSRIARALLMKPQMIILDEPFMGLDPSQRTKISDHLGHVLSEGYTRMLLLLRPQDIVPSWVTHAMYLSKSGVIEYAGPKDPNRIHSSQDSDEETRWSRPVKKVDGPVVVGLDKVNVAYDDRKVLINVDWDVRQGERWALLGKNGSGKSTLLALLLGDHPQSYSNAITLFGSPRGSGESIWDIKAKIGYVSPELHMYFPTSLTCFEVVQTGFSDVLYAKETTPEQDAAVIDMFKELRVDEGLWKKSFRSVSSGEQRLVLLCRALIKKPTLLVLDEPFQGLDDDQVARCRQYLDTELRPDQTAILVTHHDDEIPNTFGRMLRLEQGRVSECI